MNMRRVVVPVLVCVAIAVAAVAPAFLEPDKVDVLAFVGMYTVVGAGLTLLMGFAGQVSLGQGGFFAIGAYTVGLLTVRLGWSAWPAFLVAPLVTAAVGYLIGLPLLRLRGHHLAVSTLAVAIIVVTLANNLRDITGGPIGLRVPRARLAIGDTAVGPEQVYVLIWIVAGLSLVVAANIVGSRPGRALRALAQHEGAAESVGVDVNRYRLAVFALAAGFAGAAGGLFALYFRFLVPDTFRPALSILFLIIVAVGGLGNVSGALIGSVSIVVLTEALRSVSTRPDLPARAPVVLQLMVYALVLVLIMRFMPRGLVPTLLDLIRRPFTRRGDTGTPPAPLPAAQGTPALGDAGD